MKTLLPAAIAIWSLFSATNFVFAQGVAFKTTTISVGNGPSSVIAADVNNDGKVDLICTDSKDNMLTVLTNDGSGNFVLSATLNLNPYTNPACVIAVDVNGDSNLDLVVALFGSSKLMVLTNDGSGNFSSNAIYKVGLFPGADPSCVVVADVNGDGKLDLISANTTLWPNAGLTVLTNNGSGGFVLSTNFVSRNQLPSPHWVAAADINGNGKVDLITANLATPPLTVLTNDGGGNFSFNATYNVGLVPQCVVAADVNGDSNVDLVSANYSDGTLTVLTNDGSGNFTSNATYSVGSGPFFVTATDINGDGKVDLISANSKTNTLTVLTNDGSGGFVFCTTLVVGSGPRSFAVADINGDGKPDIITANFNDNTLTVLTQIIPPPKLTITSTSPDTVIVSWPLLTNNFVLQTNSDLSTTNWVVPDYTIFTNGQIESVMINTPLVGSLFFRLFAQ
jgi:hypothetical protein